MSAHTQGPWLVTGRTVYALNENGYNIFSSCVQDAHTDESVLIANARLQAAAPKLLEALQKLENEFGCRGDGWPDPKFNEARAAIAKATGQ